MNKVQVILSYPFLNRHPGRQGSRMNPDAGPVVPCKITNERPPESFVLIHVQNQNHP